MAHMLFVVVDKKYSVRLSVSSFSIMSFFSTSGFACFTDRVYVCYDSAHEKNGRISDDDLPFSYQIFIRFHGRVFTDHFSLSMRFLCCNNFLSEGIGID